MNLLLADDEAGIREGLASYFRLKGLSVTTAATCAEALERLSTANFDAVLTDWHLGDGTAGPILDRSPVPVVVVSGYPDQVTHAPNLVRVLAKPVAPPDMLQELNELWACQVAGSTSEGEVTASAAATCDLAEDVRQRFAVMLGWLDCRADSEHVRVERDGDFVTLTARCPMGFDGCDGRAVPAAGRPSADQMVQWLGGDLRFLHRDDHEVMEYRLLAHGGSADATKLVTPGGQWPAGDLTVDLEHTPVDPAAFLVLLDRIHARPVDLGPVHLRNTPPGWRLLAEASGRGHQLPKTTPAGPRLPEVLAQLWN